MNELHFIGLLFSLIAIFILYIFISKIYARSYLSSKDTTSALNKLNITYFFELDNFGNISEVTFVSGSSLENFRVITAAKVARMLIEGGVTPTAVFTRKVASR